MDKLRALEPLVKQLTFEDQREIVSEILKDLHLILTDQGLFDRVQMGGHVESAITGRDRRVRRTRRHRTEYPGM